MCDQQRLKHACTYAQTDENLCLSLEYLMSIKLLTEHNLEFLSLKGGCTGSSETTLVKMPHKWKSHAVAHLYESIMCMTHNEHFHSLTSINRILILFIRIKSAKSGGRHRENVTVFDTKYLLIFR